jgi:hypothetical protein
MVGVTFLTAPIAAGTVGAPGVFIVPLQQEFGWSTAEISSALFLVFVFSLIAMQVCFLISATIQVFLDNFAPQKAPADSGDQLHSACSGNCGNRSSGADAGNTGNAEFKAAWKALKARTTPEQRGGLRGRGVLYVSRTAREKPARILSSLANQSALGQRTGAGGF